MKSELYEQIGRSNGIHGLAPHRLHGLGERRHVRLRCDTRMTNYARPLLGVGKQVTELDKPGASWLRRLEELSKP